MNTNKEQLIDAIWLQPEKAFGCTFKRGTRYIENIKGGEYDEAGKIRLLRTGSTIMVFYNGSSREDKLDIFAYLEKYRLNTNGYKETVAALAELYGITIELTKEERTKMDRRAIAEKIAGVFVEELKQHPESKTAQYLKARGFSHDCGYFGELSAAAIGKAKQFLSDSNISWTQADFDALHLSNYYIEKGYTCVIPYICNGKVRGFKLRNLQNVKDKYSDSAELGKPLYCAALVPGRRAFIVEGQFDAVALMLGGMQNVIAMSGKAITGENQRLMQAYGIRHITYIPDIEYDEKGVRKGEAMAAAIKAFQTAKTDEGDALIKSIDIVPLNTEAECLINYKLDAADYAKSHGVAGLAAAVDMGVIHLWSWQIDELQAEAKRREATADITNWLQMQFDSIYNNCNNPYDLERIKKYIKGNPLFEKYGITPRALEDKDTWRRSVEYTNRVKMGVADLQKAVEDGANPIKVQKVVEALSEAQNNNTREEWIRQLRESFEDELQAVANQPDTIRSKWELGKVSRDGTYKKHDYIEYWPADIIVVCAPTSHGKTMFLMQSALDLVEADRRRNRRKVYLYVSCEESKRQLLERALNVYLPIDTTETGKDKEGNYCFIAGTRKKTIKAVIKRTAPPVEYYGDIQNNEHFEKLKDRINKGIEDYAGNVRPCLKLIHTDASAESICSNIHYVVEEYQNSGVEVGGVFVDYMQLLSSSAASYSRHDELKDICTALHDLAASTELPIVIAAQLNRDTLKNNKEGGIDNISVANIGEGADIERIAHDIYLLWQIDKTPLNPYRKDKKDQKADSMDELQIDGGKLGLRARRIFNKNYNAAEKTTTYTLKAGNMYIERMKARDGETEIWGIMPYHGESGKIFETDKDQMK